MFFSMIVKELVIELEKKVFIEFTYSAVVFGTAEPSAVDLVELVLLWPEKKLQFSRILWLQP